VTVFAASNPRLLARASNELLEIGDRRTGSDDNHEWLFEHLADRREHIEPVGETGFDVRLDCQRPLRRECEGVAVRRRSGQGREGDGAGRAVPADDQHELPELRAEAIGKAMHQRVG
jgi:hypothetical protein